jgi:glutathione S-transferase
MILYNGPTSPFGRFARVVALELGVPHEDKRIDVTTAEFLDDINPLRLIPTLELDDGRAVYDSRVIAAYFDSISGRPTLYPEGAGWDLQVRLALAIGVMEAGVQRRMEVTRPDAQRSAALMAKLETRIGRAIARLETLAPIIAAGDLRIDQIATAVALEYTDFRYTRDWRKAAPRLADWLARFAERPSLVETRPS